MATEYSFDIVSKVDMAELGNALNQARKEVQTRFDFKGSHPIIEQREKSIFLQGDSELLLKNLLGVLEDKLARRNVSLRFFDYGKIENTSKGGSKQELGLKEGICKEEAKRLVDLIKKNGLKIKTQIQEEQLKITSKNKDELQKVIQLVKSNEGTYPLQFVNYR
jgi:cyclic-di-GMP-binding protein